MVGINDTRTKQDKKLEYKHKQPEAIQTQQIWEMRQTGKDYFIKVA